MHTFKWMDIYYLKVNSLWVISFLNELVQIHLTTSIAIVSIRLNIFNYGYLILIFLFNINHLFADRKMLQVLLFNNNYSSQHYSFICTQSKDFKDCYVSLPIQLNISLFLHTSNNETFLFLTTRLSISNLFGHSLCVKQFSRTHR